MKLLLVLVRVLVLELVLVLVLVLGAPSLAFAQGPAPDAGVGESAYGCVESVPKGAEKPVVVDQFPQRGISGWAVTLSITVRHGKGEKVLPSGLDLSSAVEAKKVLKQAGFTVPDQTGGAPARIWSDPDDPGKSFATTHFELPLVPLPENPGRNGMVLPPLPVAVARANGEIATVCTHTHSIVVEDPIANTPNAMPHGNPPALPQREEWTSLKRALGWGALGVAVGALLAWLVYKKLTAPKPEPPPPPPRPPWEVAFEELADVRAAGLLDKQRYSEYFDRTSDAVRRYLGSRFGFDGLESTTDEILEALKRQAGGFIRIEGSGPTTESFGPAPGVALGRVAQFLRECDLVKFANLTPTLDQCARSIEIGESIVRETMPISNQAASPVSQAPPPEPPAVPPPPDKPARVRSPYEPPEQGDGS